jgi:hypothetical protein
MLSVYRFVTVSLLIGFFAPLIAGFYVAGLSMVSSAGSTVGIVLVALALLPLATVIAAPFRSPAPAAGHEGEKVGARA